jgi:16S rRNA (uracil1498-N3)-methyltransferase
MRLHRFYSTVSPKNDVFDIPDRDLAHQWKNVFRYNVGSQVILFDGLGFDYLCVISSIRSLGVSASVIQKVKSGEKPPMKLTLCMAVIKKDNFELALQKVTELGVSRVIPLLCERSEKKNLNFERLKKIAVEASEQSGRGDVPEILPISNLENILKGDSLPNNVLCLNLEGKYIKDVLNEADFKELALFVGPEGGWSEDELKIFQKYNIHCVSLGTQVLRAETAAIAVSSLLLL